VFHCSVSPLELLHCYIKDCAGKAINNLPGTISSPSLVRWCRFEEVGTARVDSVGAGYASFLDCTFKPFTDTVAVSNGGNATYIAHCSLFMRNSASYSAIESHDVWNTIIQNKSGYAGQSAIGSSNRGGNCVYGTWGAASTGTDNGGNISADPLYTDPDNGDLSLQAGSPCIDAASGILSDEDILGTERPVGASRDIGAYEYIEPTTLGDIEVLSDSVIRANFQGSFMPNTADPDLIDAANYTITRDSPVIGVALTVTDVEAAEDGTYVDLTLDREQTTGQVYRLAVSGIGGVE
jgi:hypothetical protein